MSQLDALGTYSYCSHGNAIWSEQHTRDNANVKSILTILAKQVLCRHDVENMNSIYKMIRSENNDLIVSLLLKKKIKKLHRETLKFQNGIFQEVNRLGGSLLRQVNWTQILNHSDEDQNSQSDYAASALISLYQLQKLEVEKLKVTQRFQEGRASFLQKNPQHIDVLAALIPCCHSGQYFEEDRRALLGHPPAKSACEIADRSLDRMTKATFLKEEIDVKKAQLAQEEYPSYFTHLLNKGYLKLFDYLMAIWKFHEDAAGKQNYINTMPFSQIAEVILETQKAVVQSVEEAVDSYPTAKQLLFLIGVTGTGKSTAFCYLRGDRMRRDGDQFQSEEEANLIVKGNRSGTFFPNTALVGDMLLIDFPGFEDTNGLCVALGIEMALKALVKRYPAKFLVLGELIAVKTGRAGPIDQLRIQLARLLQDSTHCVVGITKYSLDNDFKEMAHQQEMLRREVQRLREEQIKRSAEEEELKKEIIDLENAYNATKNITIQKILSDTQKRLHTLREAQSNPPSPLMQGSKEKIAECEARLMESEETLLNRLGRPHENSLVIRFEDVSNPQARERHLATLREAKTVTLEASNSMDPAHLEYFRRRFQDQLQPQLQSRVNYDLVAGAAAFQTYVLTTSLINALTLNTYPEIGQFLHSPEVNRGLVDGFDRDIVESCSERLIRQIVLDLDLEAFQRLLKDPEVINKVKKYTRKTAEELVNDLAATIVSIKSPDQSFRTDFAFKQLKALYSVSNDLWEKRERVGLKIFDIEPDTKQKGFSWIRHYVGLTFDYISETLEMVRASNPFFDKLIEHLRKAKQAILSLRQLAILVEKRKEMAHLFQSLSEVDWAKNWNESMRTKLDAIETMYGSEKWEERVTDLRHHCPKYYKENNYRKFDPLHLLGAISLLLYDQTRYVVIYNEEIIPALEAKAQQHHYHFCVRKEERGAVILVDQNYYPLLIFNIIVESWKNDPRWDLLRPESIVDQVSSFLQLFKVCTGKSIELSPTASAQLIVSHVEEAMQQLANTIHEELSHDQHGTATTMLMSMMRLVELTRLKLENDSLEKFLTKVSENEVILSVAPEGMWARFVSNFFMGPAGPPRPWFVGGLVVNKLVNSEALVNSDRTLGHLLILLTQLMDMTIFDEITQFASEFLQMDVNMPLFRALLADVYSEQAGLNKSQTETK